MVEHPSEQSIVLRDHPIEIFLSLARKRALLAFVAMAQQLCAQHRHQGQRHDGGNQDGDRQGDGKFAEQPAHHFLHEEKRDQHRDQRHGQRNDGEADLARAFQRGVQRLFAGLEITRDVLDHHDGVVHDETGGNRERHQGEIVERKAQQIHRRECADDGQRHRQAGNDGRRNAAQEQEDHQHYEGHGQRQFELPVRHRSANRRGAIRQNLHVDGRGKSCLNLRKHLLDAVHHRDHIRAGLALHIQQDGGRGVHPARKLGVLRAFHHGRHIGKMHRRAVLVGDNDVFVLVRALQLVVGIDRVGA